MRVQDNSNLSVLVIDPNPGMRGSLQTMLNQASITKIEFAVSSGTAIRQVMKRSYDIILCEYDLSSGNDDGQDGQQLLEDLRHHKLIGLWTIFIMITSEGVYSKVVSAAELTPTDYILKPFTVEMLSQRILRAIDRRNAFLPTYQLIGQGNLRQAIQSCADGEKSHARYALDFIRLRAELHVSLGELPDAEMLYMHILSTRPVGWAHLGLARTLFAQGRLIEAVDELEKLIAANPRLMAAYDLLARCHEAAGTVDKAQKVLEDAVAVSPHVIRRLRRLGEVAYEAGDVGAAEKSFKQVVAKAKYSEFRNPEDHVNLVKTLVQKGDATQAGSVIRDMERSLRGNPSVDVCRALSVAMLHQSAGNAAAAVKELNNAVTAVRAAAGLSPTLKIDLAQRCLANRLDGEATEVMLAVMNDVNSEVTPQQAASLFVKAGRPDLADTMVNQLQAQAKVLLGVAAEKANMGDFKGAVQSTLEALHMAPGNIQVLLASIGAIHKQMDELGWDHALAETCRSQIENVRKLDAQLPALKAADEEHAALKRKYGISG